MKLHDIFKCEKSTYLDAVVLIKNGKFYVTFDNDALILHHLLDYKIINNRVGFPENALSHVTEILNHHHVCYVIDGEESKKSEENTYYRLLHKVNDQMIVENMCDNLLKKIKEVVVENFDNYDKIRNFLNEL